MSDATSNNASYRPGGDAKDIWTDETSVLFTSLWDWGPADWGAIGWTGKQGRTRRGKLLAELTDPFICVCYVTSNATLGDPELAGRLAGFFLLSHETGDRDEFTHPVHHGRYPEKWRHSVRPLRAFQYLPEYRPFAIDVFPDLSTTGQAVAKWGEIIADPIKINELRSIPWIEVPVFSSRTNLSDLDEEPLSGSGMVPAGPASNRGFVVPEGTQNLPRELYVLRLSGDATAYLGRHIDGASIFKIGLSVSPDLRRQNLQKAMPRGVFRWQVVRSTRADGHDPYQGFSAAVAGEDAMKRHLARNAEWLGGEFYLASDAEIDTAWRLGREAAMVAQSSKDQQHG